MEELDPLPTLCASNLPYSVAGPFMVEALQRLPSVRLYCVMVQREVAERMAAAPGSKTYGTLSVWVQLYARMVADAAPGPVDILSPAQRGLVVWWCSSGCRRNLCPPSDRRVADRHPGGFRAAP